MKIHILTIVIKQINQVQELSCTRCTSSGGTTKNPTHKPCAGPQGVSSHETMIASELRTMVRWRHLVVALILTVVAFIDQPGFDEGWKLLIMFNFIQVSVTELVLIQYGIDTGDHVHARFAMSLGNELGLAMLL